MVDFIDYKTNLFDKLREIKDLFKDCIINHKWYSYDKLWIRLFSDKNYDLGDTDTDFPTFQKNYELLQRYVYYQYLMTEPISIDLNDVNGIKYKNKVEMDEVLRNNGVSRVIRDDEWNTAEKRGNVVVDTTPYNPIWDGNKKQQKLKRSPTKRKIKRSKRSKRRSKKM